MSAPAELVDALLAADAAGRQSLLEATEPSDLEAALVLLGRRHEQGAADVLQLIDDQSTERTLRKAARRELHRLRSVGVHPAATPAPSIALADSTPSTVEVADAWATDIDPTGSRALWLVGDPPRGGAWFAAALVNDRQGLLEVNVTETTRKRFQRELDERRGEGTWVTLPGEYAWRLIREAVDLNRAQGGSPPQRYRQLKDVFGEADGPPVRALVYETISPVEASLTPDLLEQTPLLLREPEMGGWNVTVPESLRPRALDVVRASSASLLVPGNTPEQQALQLLADVGLEALVPPVVHALRRRIEETAYIFVATDRLLAARRAVAAARALDDGQRSPDQQPFVQMLLAAGLARLLRNDAVNGRPSAEVLLELVERAAQQQGREGTPAVQSRPSGLILPR